MSYRWRALEPEDFGPAAELHNAVAARLRTSAYLDPRQLAGTLLYDNVSLADDTLGGFDPSGRLAAWAAVGHPPAPTADSRLRIPGYGAHVHPPDQEASLHLLQWQEQRARQIHAAAAPELPGSLVLQVDDHDTAQVRLLERRSYRLVRWWRRMIRELSEPARVEPIDPAVSVGPFTPDRDEPVRLLHNEVFREHFGFTEESAESWHYRCASSGYRRDLSFVLTVEDTVVGYLLSTQSDYEAQHEQYTLGIMGIRRDWRGRHLSNVLMTRGVNAGYALNLRTVALTVDSEHPTKAYRSYERLGFVPRDQRGSYEMAF